MDVRIDSRNIAMTPRWKREIEKRMADLQAGHEDLVHGRVTLTKNRHHKKLATVAEAVVVVTRRGRRTFTARKEDKTFEEAIRAAFTAMETELRKRREKRPKAGSLLPSVPQRGVISKLFPKEGYGFILQEGGGEVYFHRNAVHGFDFEDLEDSLEVGFDVEDGEKGPQAITVIPASLTEKA